MNVRWGIAGPGAMAAGFAGDLALVDDAQLVAVGSRSIDRARAFAERFDIPNAHGSYEELAADPLVDIVYVATPQSSHERDTLMFLEAGKHVLCEKPFALNAAQGQRMVDAARDRGRVPDGGDVGAVPAALPQARRAARRRCDRRTPPRRGRLRIRHASRPGASPLGCESWGRRLLDLGVYPVQLASLVLGAPTRVAAAGFVGPYGVDEHVAAVLGHPDGALAVVKAAIATSLTCTARITGTLGTIELPAFMHCPGSLTVVRLGQREVIETPWPGGGWQYQVEEVHRCLAAGEVESSSMPLSESLSILDTLDAIREQIGLRFPGE